MKSQRHKAIRDLLLQTSAASGVSIGNQDDLRLKLAAKGIHVTQATLSRDIREMKLMKGPAGYALPVLSQQEEDMPALAGVLEDFGLEVRQAQNLLVVLTTMGGAQPVAASIDNEDWDGLLGTIAGDNTVLIICSDHTAGASLKARLEAYIG